MEEILALLHQQVDRALALLNAQIRDLEDGEERSTTQMVKAAQDAHKAMLLLFEERKKIDQSRIKAGDELAAGILDLDAARDEIWRRLACLRDAGTTGALSE